MFTRAQMEARRSELLEQLADPDISDERMAELTEQAEELATAIDAFNEAEQRAQAARDRILAAVPTEQRKVPATPKRDEAPESRSIGQQFIDSQAFAEFRNRGMSGQASMEIRATLDNTATSAGAFQNPPRAADIPQTNVPRTPRIVDLIDKRTTDNNTVEYVKDTSAAAPGVAAEVAEAGIKPEATFTFEVVSEPVRTIAHWVNITRQAADDNAQAKAYVERLMGDHLMIRLDSQIANGSGVAPNLRGILNTTGIATVAPAAAEARVISLRKAITEVEKSEYAPDTVVLHPSDWELVELSQDSQGMFRVSPNVTNALAPRIWGLSVVSTTAIASGTALVGSFRLGATLWVRDQVRLLVTDSHASNFTSNILTLLAEMRAALSVWRPKAFCKVTFNGTT